TLVQGDVGSGKTVIMYFLAYISIKSKVQIVIIVPTTILARQHFDSFKRILKLDDSEIAMVTATNKNPESCPILIGTTAVLFKKNNLINNLGFLLVDEQHKFGVSQREELLNFVTKNSKYRPHFINLTATPIPRTITET